MYTRAYRAAAGEIRYGTEGVVVVDAAAEVAVVVVVVVVEPC